MLADGEQVVNGIGAEGQEKLLALRNVTVSGIRGVLERAKAILRVTTNDVD
ncbi:hypothetical protein J2Z50_003440 [Ensifer mexicanus]|nr:hypothetical protein [Sinorhizobium mexicanum]